MAKIGNTLRGRLMIDQLDRPSREALADDEPLLLQRLQMTHDPVGRLDVKGQADLANRRAVAPALNLFANELIDFPLPVRQLAEVGHGHPLLQKDLELPVTPLAHEAIGA